MLSIAVHGQVPSRIDFARDVQPIFRAHCISCHGPDLQMSALRLDRRADALRGGTQTVIGPGNADGSRLYHRVAGSHVGLRMPPAGALTDDQIGIIRQWIDEGAPWPDALAGSVPAPPTHPDATALAAAIRATDTSTLDRLIRPGSPGVSGHASDGSTALMNAAYYGDAALVKRVMAAGGDLDARGPAGATALMYGAGDADVLRLLLDAGADANARSDDGRTALAIASGIAGASASVQLLLDYGADPTITRRSDVSPLHEAARVGNAAAFELLLKYGADSDAEDVSEAFVRTNCGRCAALLGAEGSLPRQPPEPGAAATAPLYDPGRLGRPTPVDVQSVSDEAIRAAVKRSLPLLQDVGVSFVQQTGCVSCHHNSLVSMAVATARASGYGVDEEQAARQTTLTAEYLATWRARTIQNMAVSGGSDALGYLLFGLGEDRYPADAITDAPAVWLARRQARDGHWPVQQIRPPIESNDVQVTVLAMRALQRFAPPSRRAAFDGAIARAREWLMDAEAEDTEERAFRLLGLTWSGAPRQAIVRAAEDLIASRQGDGGWAQASTLSSDAYATGQALVALTISRTTGIDERAYRRGLEYLLRTQIEDGSWIVETHAVAMQPYFETGFPYGANQWISVAATAWATTALALAK